MKKPLLLLFTVLFSCSFTMQAQQHRTCGTTEHYRQAVLNDPSILTRREELEQQIQAIIENHKAERNQATNTVIVTVPVVLHIVYYTPAENISTQQALSQIDVLNTDYGHRNADSTLTPAVFQSLMANTGIQFCMAQRDPSGNLTDGIERRSTTIQNIGGTNKYYNTSLGGLNAWDHTQYLNFWICSIDGGSTLGFSYLPGTTGAADDGVVIDPIFWGTTGTVSAPFNGGRTATHEVGHYFNMEHIWGDEPACAVDDGVSDTPLQKGENYGCPTYPQTSQSGGRCNTSDPSSMYMNYMDYTDDACMVMFTYGQAARMQAVVDAGAGIRKALLTSQGCLAPVGINQVNAGSWLSLSSNPTKGLVEFSTLSSENTMNVNVTDLAGKIVLTTAFHNQNRCSIDLSSFPAGIYLMQVSGSEGKAVRKIVKE